MARCASRGRQEFPNVHPGQRRSALVALLHPYFLVLEAFLWDKPRGLKTFGITPEFAAVALALVLAS